MSTNSSTGCRENVRQFLEIDFVLTYRQGLQLDFMRGWGWLPTPFLPFPWFEQIGELFDGENALSLILAHDPCCHAIE